MDAQSLVVWLGFVGVLTLVPAVLWVGTLTRPAAPRTTSAALLLLGVAMWISGAVPRWAAALTAVAQPLHFVAAVVLANHQLDFAAWGLNAVGFTAVAVAMPRSPALPTDRREFSPSDTS